MVYNIISKGQLDFMRPDMEFLCTLGKNLQKNGLYIAGGSIVCAFKGLPINDIDVLSTSTDINMPVTFRASIPPSWGFTSNPNPNAKFADDYYMTTDEGRPFKVQLIHPKGKSVGTPDEVLQYFDLVNCMVYVNSDGIVKAPKGWTLYNTLFRKDILLGHPSSPEYTYERVLKYVDRGFTCDTKKILKNLMAIKHAQGLIKLFEGVINAPEASPRQEYNLFSDTLRVKSKNISKQSYIEPNNIMLTYDEAQRVVSEVRMFIHKTLIYEDITIPDSLMRLIKEASIDKLVTTAPSVDTSWDF